MKPLRLRRGSLCLSFNLIVSNKRIAEVKLKDISPKCYILNCKDISISTFKKIKKILQSVTNDF